MLLFWHFPSPHAGWFTQNSNDPAGKSRSQTCDINHVFQTRVKHICKLVPCEIWPVNDTCYMAHELLLSCQICLDMSRHIVFITTSHLSTTHQCKSDAAALHNWLDMTNTEYMVRYPYTWLKPCTRLQTRSLSNSSFHKIPWNDIVISSCPMTPSLWTQCPSLQSKDD